MSAVAGALSAARAVGVEISVDGNDLMLEARVPPPPNILELLSCHKPAILMRLRPGPDGWSAEDWQSFFDERSARAEYGNGLTRAMVEGRAFACCIAEWLNRNFEISPPARCLFCGDAEYPHDVLLPFGIDPSGRVWLHSRCWPTWHGRRKAQAVASLAAMGITPPKFPNDFGKNGST